jgi:hypothetical protein
MAAGAEDPSDARGAAAKPAEGGLQQLDRNLLLLKFSRQAAIARRGLPRSASAEDLAIPGVSGLIHGLCCDRGQRYCGPSCRATARRLQSRQAGRRYQRERTGQFTSSGSAATGTVRPT